jgi:hypothetical protein
VCPFAQGTVAPPLREQLREGWSYRLAGGGKPVASNWGISSFRFRVDHRVLEVRNLPDAAVTRCLACSICSIIFGWKCRYTIAKSLASSSHSSFPESPDCGPSFGYRHVYAERGCGMADDVAHDESDVALIGFRFRDNASFGYMCRLHGLWWHTRRMKAAGPIPFASSISTYASRLRFFQQ